MSGFLVDTNVISEILKPSSDLNVKTWSLQTDTESLFLSVVSPGELRKGIAILPPSARRSELERSIEAQLPRWFHTRMLPVTRSIAERWGEMEAVRQLAGNPLDAPDGMIAATAVEHGLTVVTRNAKDFADLGMPILNAWAI